MVLTYVLGVSIFSIFYFIHGLRWVHEGGDFTCSYYVVVLFEAGFSHCIHCRAFYIGNKSNVHCVWLVLYSVMQLFSLRHFVELLSVPYYVLSSQYRTRVRVGFVHLCAVSSSLM